MKTKVVVRQLLRQTGYDVVRFPTPVPRLGGNIERRMRLLNHYGINAIFDVGANAGQYAIGMRQSGYNGRILSFEPISMVYRLLQEKSAKDPCWDSIPIALGHYDGTATIHVANNGAASSSMLEMLPRVLESAPEAAYIGTEQVTVQRLDSMFTECFRPGDKVMMKIDAQGFEKNVLEGARQSLKNIIGIQMEMSLVPLYKDEPLLAEMIQFLTEQGFCLMHLEPGFDDTNSGQLLQCDGIFFRS